MGIVGRRCRNHGARRSAGGGRGGTTAIRAPIGRAPCGRARSGGSRRPGRRSDAAAPVDRRRVDRGTGRVDSWCGGGTHAEAPHRATAGRTVGFRSLAFVEQWTTGLRVNEYIRTGRGELGAIMRQLGGQWQTREVAGLLRWLRDFNIGRVDKVRFTGVEYYLTGPAACDEVDAYLAGTAPEGWPSSAVTYGRSGPPQRIWTTSSVGTGACRTAPEPEPPSPHRRPTRAGPPLPEHRLLSARLVRPPLPVHRLHLRPRRRQPGPRPIRRHATTRPGLVRTPPRHSPPRPVRPGSTPLGRRPGAALAYGPIKTRGLTHAGPDSYLDGGSLGDWFDMIIHRQEVTPSAPI